MHQREELTVMTKQADVSAGKRSRPHAGWVAATAVVAGLLASPWAVAQATTAPVQPVQPMAVQPVAGAAPLQTDVNSQRQARNLPATAPLGSVPDAATTPAGTAMNPATPASLAEPQPLPSLAAVGADYKLAPNDLLEFDIYGVPNMRRDVRINASGVISLPLIGPVPVVGLTGQQAEQLIAARYAEKYLQDPQVSIFVKEFTTQRITIEGAVLKPGIYPVMGQLSLLRALALAGGYAQYAELREIMLYRTTPDGQRVTMSYDLEKVRSGEQMDPEILPDDIVVVKRNTSRTALRDSIFRDIIDTINPFSNR